MLDWLWRNHDFLAQQQGCERMFECAKGEAGFANNYKGMGPKQCTTGTPTEYLLFLVREQLYQITPLLIMLKKVGRGGWRKLPWAHTFQAKLDCQIWLIGSEGVRGFGGRNQFWTAASTKPARLHYSQPCAIPWIILPIPELANAFQNLLRHSFISIFDVWIRWNRNVSLRRSVS